MRRTIPLQTILVALSTLLHISGPASAQVGYTLSSLEAMVADADLIVRGPIVGVAIHQTKEPLVWLDVNLKIAETIKGATGSESLSFALQAVKGDKRWDQFVESGEEQLWFLMKSGREVSGETPAETEIMARYDYKPCRYWFRITLDREGDVEIPASRPPPPIFTMNFELLKNRDEILAASRAAVEAEPEARPASYGFALPRIVAQRTGTSGDANAFIVPVDHRLEGLAHDLISRPENIVHGEDESTANRLRAEGIKALRTFKSEKNVALLIGLLDHPAIVGKTGIEEKEYFVRKEAWEVLKEWNVPVEKPVIVVGRDPRPPQSDAELRFWLENMVWHHHFGLTEITAATNLEDEAIEKAQERFNIYGTTRPKRAADAPLLILPYPGGRHPRTGFREGAIRPQRETKISVFLPWEERSYVVVDVPEAIWSNLGLTYLAHTHVPTIWTEKNITLEPLEWSRGDDGILETRRKLPNGIEFGTKIIPGREVVRMEMWLKNGTREILTGLRVQNCIMLKNAIGFFHQNNENKIFRSPYAVVHDEAKRRWIITAWDPCHRCWGNPKCPCLHSDPKFPDCAPGETQRLRGWLSFYEGGDIDAEMERIENTGWREAPFSSAKY